MEKVKEKSKIDPSVLQIAWNTISIIITLALIIAYITSSGPVFTEDYKSKNIRIVSNKIDDFKDSIIKYRAIHNDSIANKFTDSCNKYSFIHNYLIK